MTEEEIQALVERYDRDASIAYDLSGQELDALLTEKGELEPIVDAINALSGVSLLQRADDLGCDLMDFFYDTQCRV